MEFANEIFGIQFNAKANKFAEDFDTFVHDTDNAFFVSKKTFEHDESDEGGMKFKYKYCIECGMCFDSGEKPMRFYNLLLVPMAESLCPSAMQNVVDCCGIEKSEITPYDVSSYGYNVPIGMLNIDDADENEDWDETILNNIANVYEFPIDRMRGFYLDRPINRIGTTGWDEIESAVLGTDPFAKFFNK